MLSQLEKVFISGSPFAPLNLTYQCLIPRVGVISAVPYFSHYLYPLNPSTPMPPHPSLSLLVPVVEACTQAYLQATCPIPCYLRLVPIVSGRPTLTHVATSAYLRQKTLTTCHRILRWRQKGTSIYKPLDFKMHLVQLLCIY
jgi:hypothetical protein